MISEAFAMAGNSVGGAAGNQAAWQPLVMMALMFGVFYFLLIRPQQKRAKAHRDMIAELKVGDSVVTAGGVHGKISTMQDDTVTLEVAAGVKIKFSRTAIASKI